MTFKKLSSLLEVDTLDVRNKLDYVQYNFFDKDAKFDFAPR